MADLIVGICRFSFLGRGDWAAYAGVERGSEQEAKIQAEVAERLYSAARMEQRFRTFEALTLPSIKAQSRKDFAFIVLSSVAMPLIYRERLARLCAGDPNIHLVFADTPQLGNALEPVLGQISEGGKHRLVQFRLDDDDCVCIDYIRALRKAADAAKDYYAFAFTLPRALVVTSYADAEPAYCEWHKMLHSAGAAVRPRLSSQSVFHFGHYALGRRFPTISDPTMHGSLHLKSEGHDSRRMTPRRGSDLQLLGQEAFIPHLERNFPFLSVDKLSSLVQRR